MIKNVDQIRAASTYEIIRQYVDLKKRGVNWLGLCPFHNEKTPSFNVNPAKNIYKCFGCGASGDGISFLMDHQNLTYPEALEAAAKVAGMQVEYEDHAKRAEYLQRTKEERDQKTALAAELHKALVHYTTNTDLSKLDLGERKYSETTLRKFQICQGTNDLVKTAQASGWDIEKLSEVGIISSREAGRFTDFFRDRLLFPICDHRGQVVGFAGRKPASDTNKENPKYINSKDSLLYQKEEHLYGLHLAIKAIRQHETALLVEGYTDVITLHENGIENVVASCGTALTDRQCQLLKRYTDTVIILRDGDEAGSKAAQRDVEILLENGIMPKVCLMPEGEDPDSFMRKQHAKGFQFYLDEKTQDGLIWRAMLDYSDDPFQKQKNIKKAAELIARIDSSGLRETYVRELTQKGRFGNIKKILQEEIEAEQKKRLVKTSKLSQEQQADAIEYGLYESHNRYYVTSDPNNTGFAISNFIVRGVMLIIGSKDSQRVVEIRNEHGKTYLLIIDSKFLTGYTDFKKEVERMGNFLFTGEAKYFDRVKSKIYRETKDCFPIQVMGWHKDGFYTWGNGISVDGQFKPVDEYGIIEHGGTRYFLPAFSRLGDQLKGDDMEEEHEFEKKFVFYPQPACINTVEWTSRMFTVHGWNGAIACAFIIASLFRDIIFRKFQFFPHLNLFGPSGAGKTYLARSVMAVFGKGNQQDPFNLASGTPIAFKRRLAQVSNGVVWFDEYSNDIDFKRVEALKGAYDGAGHQRGIATDDNRVKTTKVKSALVISGQQQPTKDIALFKRVISLNCKSGRNTLDHQREGRILKELEESGQLTQLAQHFLTFRDFVDEKFAEYFEWWRVHMNTRLGDQAGFVEDRIIQNYLIPLTVLHMLHENDKLQLGFDMKGLIEAVKNSIIEQSESIFSEDELSIFWRIVVYLLETGQIAHREDILVEERTHETFMNELARGERKDSQEKRFSEKKILVYLRFSKVHPMYQERHARQRGRYGLDIGALQYYLRTSPAYMGQKRTKKFSRDKVVSCYVFELSELPVELQLTEEVDSFNASQQQTSAPF